MDEIDYEALKSSITPTVIHDIEDGLYSLTRRYPFRSCGGGKRFISLEIFTVKELPDEFFIEIKDLLNKYCNSKE